jgi:hypothetical protein
MTDVRKRYLMHGAAFNLRVSLRELFGIGMPRSLQGRAAALCAALLALLIILREALCDLTVFIFKRPRHSAPRSPRK